MTGPSLKKLHSHHAIHEGVYSEARELTELLQKVMKDKEKENYKSEVLDALIEHWETRVLAHAQSEEDGLFPEALKQNEVSIETIAMLKRDHQILRILVDEIKKDYKKKNSLNDDILDRLKALLCILSIHNREEEKHILHDH